MIFHKLSSEDLDLWIENNKTNKYLIASLYITAIAEVIANSSMFGGINSDSFKIKRKKTIKNIK